MLGDLGNYRYTNMKPLIAHIKIYSRILLYDFLYLMVIFWILCGSKINKFRHFDLVCCLNVVDWNQP